MSLFTITADDTLVLNNRVLNDFAYDDVSAITFPNEKVKSRTGKNKNTIFAKDETGQNANMEIHLVKGSSDDVFMQKIINDSDRDFAATQLLNGRFVKRLGDGQGNVVNEVYNLRGGMIVKNPESKENVSGDTAQAVSVYRVIFATAVRSIQ